MADSCVEGGRRGRGREAEKPIMATTDKSNNTSTTPGFKLFGTRIVTVKEPTSQLQRNQPIPTSEPTSASPDKPQSTTGNDNPPATPQTAASGLACPRCKSKETKFCYFNNYNVNQPRHFCRGCHRYWTAGGALRNVPVGAGRRKAGASSATTSTGSPGIDGGGANDFEMSNGLMMDGVVVQQWLMSHDGGFPSKRPHITSFHDRIL